MPAALFVALAIAGAGQAPAPAAAPPSPPVAATLQGAVMFDMASRFTGRTHRIYLAVPGGAPPKDGWPVIFVLDGDQSFGTALSQMPDVDGLGRHRAILVGIGYGKSRLDVRRLRQHELTPYPPAPGSPDSAPAEAYGGADNFHRFIAEELRPFLAARHPIDDKDQTLIGYSLGGLYALHVLFHHPTEFRTVVAGSPSIWWRRREVLKGEAAFAQAVTAGKAAPRVLITSGAREEEPLGVGMADTAETRKAVAESAMIGNARSLAERLKALHGAPGYQVRYVLFADESHGSGTAASMSRAINFAVSE